MPVETLAFLFAVLGVSGAAAARAAQALNVLQSLMSWLERRKAAHEAQRQQKEQQDYWKRQLEHDRYLDFLMRTQNEQLATLVELTRRMVQQVSSRGELVPLLDESKLPALLRPQQSDPETQALLERDLADWRSEDVVAAARKRHEIETFFSTQLESRIMGYSDEQERDLTAVFRSKEVLLRSLQTMRAHHGMFVVPVYPHAPEFAAMPAQMRDVVTEYNAAREGYLRASSESSTSPTSHRSAPPLLIADDLLQGPVELNSVTIQRIHAYLAGFPTICLQVAVGDGEVTLEGWCWLCGGDIVSTPRTTFSLASLQSSGLDMPHAVIGLSQLFLLLLADALSVGGFEGVSVLPYALKNAMGGAGTLSALEPWYSCLRRVFGEHYGAAGLQGLPETDANHELREALANLRWEVSRQNRGVVSPIEFASHEHYFVAVFTTREYPFPLIVLAIEADLPEKARVYRWVTHTETDMRAAKPDEWQAVLHRAALTFESSRHEFSLFCTGISLLIQLLTTG